MILDCSLPGCQSNGTHGHFACEQPISNECFEIVIVLIMLTRRFFKETPCSHLWQGTTMYLDSGNGWKIRCNRYLLSLFAFPDLLDVSTRDSPHFRCLGRMTLVGRHFTEVNSLQSMLMLVSDNKHCKRSTFSTSCEKLVLLDRKKRENSIYLFLCLELFSSRVLTRLLRDWIGTLRMPMKRKKSPISRWIFIPSTIKKSWRQWTVLLTETDGTTEKLYRLTPSTALLGIYTVPYRTVTNFLIPYRTDIERIGGIPSREIPYRKEKFRSFLWGYYQS